MKLGQFVVQSLVWLSLAGGMSSTLHAATSIVEIFSFRFSPSNIVVNVGDTIIWTNRASLSHDTTQGLASTPDAQRLWKSPNLPAFTGNFRFTFNTPGTFRYLCLQHALTQPQQTGTVSVIGNFPPTVSISSPAGGSRHPVPPSFDVTATASDPDGAVTNVQFLAFSAESGTVSLGMDADAPYAVRMPNLPARAYQLRAVAMDDGGTSTTSAIVNILLAQPVPLQLVDPMVSGADQIRFDLTTTFGLTYIIEQTPDVFGGWTPVSTNVATGAVYRIIRPFPTAAPTQSFFRAFIQP